MGNSIIHQVHFSDYLDRAGRADFVARDLNEKALRGIEPPRDCHQWSKRPGCPRAGCALAGSTIWGLLLSSKIIKEAIPAALSLAMHNILSWLALAFTGFHALVLLLDNYYTYTLSSLTIPFIGPYRPGWVGLGIVGFYLMLLVVLSFQFRKQIGQKRWRTLHAFSFIIFVLAAVHGIAAGTDSSKFGMQIMYLGSGLLVLFLTNYRLLTRKTKQIREQPVRITN